MLFKLPIISRDAEAVEKVRKYALKFVKELQHVPYEAALQQLRLFLRTHRRFRGNLMPVFMVTHGLLDFPMEHISTHSTHKGLFYRAYEFHQQRCCTRRR